jgi:hypothetical protein
MFLDGAGRGPAEASVNASRSAYEDCVEACARLEDAGASLDRPERIDFSQRATTVDQLAIEAALERLELDGCALLHVGIGNSSLALRFAGRAARIDGVTVSLDEQRTAEAYPGAYGCVHLLNKHDDLLSRKLARRYDFIVDNNLSGFACCLLHFHQMLASYVECLVPGGKILTHRRGLEWSAGDPRWKLSYQDLVRLGATYPLRASELGDDVYALERLEAHEVRS